MLENEFFPTPAPVIEKMLAPHNAGYLGWTNNQMCHYRPPILDPSGGAGAILDYITGTLGVPKHQCLAAEIDIELRFVLQGKGYGLIGTDWLAYDEPIRYGFIIMNPPFSKGVDHVLKAWEHLQDGGHLIALLNAETIRNPHDKKRQLLINHMVGGPDGWREITEEQLRTGDEFIAAALRWLEAQGRIEWLGQCFKEAERPTDVEVVLIRMEKPVRDTTIEFDAKSFEQDEAIKTEEFSENPLAFPDAIRDLVTRYNLARKILLERDTAQRKLDFYLNGICDPAVDTPGHGEAVSMQQKIGIDQQLLTLKNRFWNVIFKRTKLEAKATRKFREKFHEFVSTQVTMAFTEQNIHELLSMLIQNQEQIIRDCCVEVFDKATAYHEKNKIHTEGWKTNKSYRVNKRIILPNGVKVDRWGSWSADYDTGYFLDDLDRVLCWLSGIKFEDLGEERTYESIRNHIHKIKTREVPYDQSFSSRFFEIRAFKKGTVHIDFKDLALLAQFNRTAAEGKNWIGGGY